MDDILEKLDSMNDLVDELDYDYSVNEARISTMEQFEEELLTPFLEQKRQLFYRGERIKSLKRPLLPTLFRDRDSFRSLDGLYVDIDVDYLLYYFKANGCYVDLFWSTFGEVSRYRMYDICAFSQHYLDLSPFIDFTRSIYVAISFALKGKHSFEEDALLYTVEIEDGTYYTRDRVTADCWLNDYQVRVYDPDKKPGNHMEVTLISPEAKIIDIATNDLMKFQQGVFLLLDHFSLVNHLYLTKHVRDSVKISKYVLDKDLCPLLTDIVAQKAPWYNFDNLLDVGSGLRTAMEFRSSEL